MIKNCIIAILLAVLVSGGLLSGLIIRADAEREDVAFKMLKFGGVLLDVLADENIKLSNEVLTLREENQCLSEQLELKTQETTKLTSSIDSLVDFVKRNQTKPTKMKASAYTAEENGGYKKTSMGRIPKTKRTIAVSRDRKDLLGKQIRIHGWGDGVVEDLMGPQWTNKLDIYTSGKEEAYKWGVRTVSIVVLPDKKEDILLLSEFGLI